MSPSKCPSILECHKVRIILEQDGFVEQMVNEVNSVCSICLGPNSYEYSQVLANGVTHKLSQ
jgi:hypothetical protein